MLLTSFAVVVWLGFRAVQLQQEGKALEAVLASQQQQVNSSERLRASLDALAADTQRLADAGNPNARLLVEELRRRGVTINPNAATPPSAPASN